MTKDGFKTKTGPVNPLEDNCCAGTCSVSGAFLAML